MTMQRSLALCAAVLLICTSIHAQSVLSAPEPPPPSVPEVKPIRVSDDSPIPVVRLGISGGYNLALHSADGMSLPEIPSCCPGYTSTTGGGVALGAEAAFILSKSLDLLARLTYQTASATMTTDEMTTVRIGNTAKETALRHTLTSSLGMLFLEPGVEYRMASGFGFIGGVRIGVLMNATYTESESFADPSIPYDYSDGSGVHNASAGDLPQKNALQFGLFVGARYHIALNSAKTFHLVPAVEFAPLFSEIVKETSWSVSSFRASIGLTITLNRYEALGSPLRP